MWGEVVHVGQQAVRVHRRQDCQGRTCTIHNPTEHHMRAWAQHYRDDTNVIERRCVHGYGHPDPDQFDYWWVMRMMYKTIHGCDGCCHFPRPERKEITE